MSREILPYHAEDISALARALKAQLAEKLSASPAPPGHVEMLNMLARAAGFGNFQHYRAQLLARARIERPAAPAAPVDFVKLRRLLAYFGPEGRLTRWPSKYSHQVPCLWVIWSRIPARRDFTEREVNAMITAQHDFGDYALLRRELVNHKLMERTIDGRVYRRLERQPPAEALALIRQLGDR